ncbi:unnamed protein product [Cunninghamella echinulata]
MFMRFSTLAVIAAAMLMSTQAAPLTTRHASAKANLKANAGATLVLPGLDNVTHLLSVTAIFSEIQTLPADVQGQLFAVLNDPTQLVDVIAGLPQTVQKALTDLPTQVQGLPANLLKQLATLQTDLTTLPQQLQTVLKTLPAALQAQLISVPTVLTEVQTLVSSGLTKNIQGQLQALPNKVLAKLNAGDISSALTVFQGVISKVGGITALPTDLQQHLSFVQTTLLQITQLSSNGNGVAGGLVGGIVGQIQGVATGLVGNVEGLVGGTVTTVFGLAAEVKNTVTVTVSQLHVVDGGLISSVEGGVISLPTTLIQGTVLETVASVTKGKLSEIPVASLINLQGLQVTQLTDKLALPLSVAKELKLA